MPSLAKQVCIHAKTQMQLSWDQFGIVLSFAHLGLERLYHLHQGPYLVRFYVFGGSACQHVSKKSLKSIQDASKTDVLENSSVFKLNAL